MDSLGRREGQICLNEQVVEEACRESWVRYIKCAREVLRVVIVTEKERVKAIPTAQNVLTEMRCRLFEFLGVQIDSCTLKCLWWRSSPDRPMTGRYD